MHINDKSKNNSSNTTNNGSSNINNYKNKTALLDAAGFAGKAAMSARTLGFRTQSKHKKFQPVK